MRSLEKTNGKFTKNGRELQELLGSTKKHTEWAKSQANRLGLKEGVDFKIILPFEGKKVSKINSKTFYFTEAAAHRIAGRNEVKTEAAAMVKDNFAMQAITMGQHNENSLYFFWLIPTRILS
jgi:phage anti-repressor protein